MSHPRRLINAQPEMPAGFALPTRLNGEGHARSGFISPGDLQNEVSGGREPLVCPSLHEFMPGLSYRLIIVFPEGHSPRLQEFRGWVSLGPEVRETGYDVLD